MRYIYCQHWDERQREPRGLLAEAEARCRYAGDVREPDNWFTVAVVGEEGEFEDVLMGVLEVLPYGDYIRTRIIDQLNRVVVVYHFKSNDERMFLQGIVHYTYADDSNYYRLSQSAVVDSLDFRAEDSYMEYRVDDHSQPTVEVREYRDVDLSANWEPLPAFGEWDKFVRYRGGLPVR
jgi:hypothetical protein